MDENEIKNNTGTMIKVSATVLSFALALIIFFGSNQTIYEGSLFDVPQGFSVSAFLFFITIELCFFTLNIEKKSKKILKNFYIASCFSFLSSILMIFLSAFKTIGFESGVLPIHKIIENLFALLGSTIIGYIALFSILIPLIIFLYFKIILKS